MIQKKYLCKDYRSIEEAVLQIADKVSSTPHRSAVLTIYEKGFSADEIRSLITLIKSQNIPGLQIAGISLTLIAELMPEGTGALLNLLLTEEADIEVVTVTCVPGEEVQAALKLKERLDAHGCVKAVELFGSNMELNVTRFMENAMEGHHDAVLFGTTNIRNLLKKITSENGEHTVEVTQDSSMDLPDEFVFGEDIIYDGFVAVVFSGENLKVKANYALGWNPIGRELPVELGKNSPMGETFVKKIASIPAVDIYKEYLGVYPNEYFISNICEFPFMVEREGIKICLIPLDHGKDGELFFMMTLREGEKIRYSFASHDEVLQASLDSLLDMEDFAPEAVFLTLCGNRINFLKEDAHLEWDGWAKMVPDHALMHGACELYYHDGKGGILNSAHLSVGMREKEAPSEKKCYEHPTVESLRKTRTLTLSDRMSTFLDKITMELVDMADQAKAANNAKSAFLSHMSHEIRTPINAILGMDDMILNEGKDPVIADYADGIRSAGNNLLDIVNDILDLSSIEAGKMKIAPVEYEMISVVKDLYNVVRLRAEAKGLKVILDIDESIPSVMLGDVKRIKQVVTNILTNAVKYTEQGSVTFTVQKIEELDAAGTVFAADEDHPCSKVVKIRATVRDTGIGIRPEDKERLFDEYERFDEKRNASVEGTGLGLSITRELLELMGSSLYLESTYGEGSVFGFDILQGVVSDEPLGDVRTKISTTAVKKKRHNFTAEEARILVADDNAVNLNVFCKLLKNTRIQIDAVRSGEEAVELVRKNEYDVIFLDHLMPDMDGPETLRRIKELEKNRSKETPVISLTANAESDAREEYLKMGFRDYLSKPIKRELLEDMLFFHISPEKIRTVSSDEE